MGESCLHTNELSPRNSDRCDDRSLGNQLYRISVCRHRGSLIERHGETMATPRARARCRLPHLRSACFWQMAPAIESISNCRSNTRRKRCANERLPRLRRASIGTVA